MTSNSNSPLSPTSQKHTTSQPPEYEDAEMLDAEHDDQEDQEDPANENSEPHPETRSPRESRKDKDLNTFLTSMDKYAPIVLPDT
jgi:hypothetical protein